MGGQNGSWWGGGKYRLGGRPSPHISGPGIQFLTRHRQTGLVADLGVWEGRNLSTLLSLGSPIAATDTPEARTVTEVTVREYQTVRFHEARLSSLPFRDGELGAALCWRVLHNLTSEGELASAFAEINRVIVLGAPLLIAVRSEHQRDFWARQRAFVRRLPNGNGGTREDVYFTRGGLTFMSELLGFRVEHVVEDVEGGEEVDGKPVKNHYLVAHLIKTAEPRRGHREVAERLIVRAG